MSNGNTHFDFIVIGGGSGGYAAARTAHDHGKKVAIVDGAEQLGGLCILRGCMPSKTLIYSAEIAHLANHAEQFGLDIPSAKVNMAALQARKQKIIGEFTDYRVNELESDRFTLFRHHAKFIDPKTIELTDGTKLTADKFIISTGSKINTPPVPGLAEAPTLTSDDILSLDALPESIIVLGGGVIACELAQFLCRAGVKVTQIQRSPFILKEGSPKAAAALQEALRANGIELFTDTTLKSIDYQNGQITASFEHEGKTVMRNAQVLFNAMGRKPATAELNLEAAGIDLLKSGHIKTNEYQQSTNKNVYAAGDCAGPHEIVHIAILQGECSAHHACGKPATPVSYRDLTKVIFTDPQVASAGLSEKDLKAQSIPYISAEYAFEDNGKSILMDAIEGYVQIFAHKETSQVLGAECVGKDASELIHSLAVAVTLKATVHGLLKVHWYHPTLAEIWTYPLEEIAEQLSSDKEHPACIIEYH